VRHIIVPLVFLLGGGCSSAPVRRAGPVDIPLPRPPRSLLDLVEQLGAADAPSRAAAAWALAGGGDVEASIIWALKAALEDPSAPVREAATWALSHVTSPGFDRKELTDSPPRVLVQAKPVYPRAAFDAKLEGVVIVDFLINELGRVSHAEIRRSWPGLDEAALACNPGFAVRAGQAKRKTGSLRSAVLLLSGSTEAPRKRRGAVGARIR
jgi:TonB family protein